MTDGRTRQPASERPACGACPSRTSPRRQSPTASPAPFFVHLKSSRPQPSTALPTTGDSFYGVRTLACADRRVHSAGHRRLHTKSSAAGQYAGAPTACAAPASLTPVHSFIIPCAQVIHSSYFVSGYRVCCYSRARTSGVGCGLKIHTPCPVRSDKKTRASGVRATPCTNTVVRPGASISLNICRTSSNAKPDLSRVHTVPSLTGHVVWRRIKGSPSCQHNCNIAVH